MKKMGKTKREKDRSDMIPVLLSFFAFELLGKLDETSVSTGDVFIASIL